MYLDNYQITENATSYFMKNLDNVDMDSTDVIEIKKELVESIGVGEDEALLVLLAVIEEARRDTAKSTERKILPSVFVTEEDFKESLKLKLYALSAEDLIQEILDMNFYQIKDFFMKESFERIDY